MAATSNTMSVQIRDGKLRASPSFLGTIAGTVVYGDRVTVLQESGPWRKVAAPGGARGWIHVSALTVKRIELRAGAEDVERAATTDELALAGKGFNRQVEEEFRSRHPELNYAWLDRMERIRFTPREMAAFLAKGGVVPKGGIS